MRRLVMAAAAAVVSAQIVSAPSSNACEPGDSNAWWIKHAPGTPSHFPEGAFKAEIDGYYVGYASAWKLQIDRPLAKPTKKKKFERIIVTSPPTGAPDAQTKGFIKKGDTVRGWAYAPAGQLLFGNLGCV